jgi:hypothetical protein
MPPSLFRHSTAVQESPCEFYEKAGPTTTTKSAGSVGLLGCRLHDSGLASLELAGKAYTIQLAFDMSGKATQDETVRVSPHRRKQTSKLSLRSKKQRLPSERVKESLA